MAQLPLLNAQTGTTYTTVLLDAGKLVTLSNKGTAHQFTALEDNTVFCCIHAIRDGDELDSVASQDITPEQAFELLTQYPLRAK